MSAFIKSLRRSRLLACLLPALAATALMSTALPAVAQVETTSLRLASRDIGATQRLTLMLNKSMIVDLPVDVKEVVVSQPSIAAAIVRTKQRVIVQGVGAGDTNIFFFDAAGRTISVLDLRIVKEVSQVGSALQDALARTLPGSHLKVESVALGDTNRVVLTGTVQSQDDFDRANQMAIQFAGGVDNVANLSTVGGAQQVMLHVVVAEVSRSTAKELGINLSGSAIIGSTSVGLNSAQSSLTNGLNLGINVPNFTLNAQLRALESRGAVKTLAEPTLTAISGQPANFLAGGEVPILSSIEENGSRTFQYKELGVKLAFTPTIRSNGVIGLKVNTELSEVAENGFEINGTTIPGFNTRRADTVVEMRAGETLAIAGMIQEKMRQQISGLPVLGHIPIIGALFRSREFQRSQTELVVLVTPYLARPTTEAMPLPTDEYQTATDAEAVFLGLMEKKYSVGGGDTRGGLKGSIGFVLD